MPTDAEIQAAIDAINNKKAYTGAGLPAGFVMDQNTGITYIQGEGGKLRPATQAEYAAAMSAERGAVASANSASAGVAASISANAQKEIARMNIAANRESDTNKNAISENQFGFTAQQTARQQAIQQLQIAQTGVLTAAQDAEQAQIQRAQLSQMGSDTQTRANIAALDRVENARQANLSAAVTQWKTAMDLIPQMGQLSVNESQQIMNLMQNGGDYLARSFAQSGGKSPLAPVLQADQINALTDTIGKLRGTVNDALAQGPAATNGGPTGNTGYVAPQGPGAYTPPNLGGLPTIGNTPQYTPTVLPQSTMPTAGAPSSTGNSYGGGGGGFTPPSIPMPTPGPMPTPEPIGIHISPNGSGAPGYANDTAGEPQDTAGPSTFVPPPVNPIPPINTWPGGLPYDEKAPGMAKGSKGFTTLNHFRVGEKGGPKSTEHVFNPTHAPLVVIPEPKMDKAGGKKVKGFATGTGDASGGGDSGSQTAGGFSWSPTGAGITQNGSLYTGSSAPATAPAGTPSNATWNGSNFQWASSNPTVPQPPPQANYNVPTPAQAPAPSWMQMSSPTPPLEQHYTQQQLVDQAIATTPPSVAALFGGQRVPSPVALPDTVGGGTTLPGFTSRELGSLNKDDLAALGTRTNVQYNAPLSYIQDNVARQYAPQTPVNPLYSRYFQGFTGRAGI